MRSRIRYEGLFRRSRNLVMEKECELLEEKKTSETKQSVCLNIDSTLRNMDQSI